MYLLEEDLKFPKDSFKSMKYQPYEMKPSFSMVRVYQWWNYWYGEVYISFSGGLDSTVLAYIVCQAYRKYKLTGKIPLVFADTGTEFPEIREFVKTYTKWLKEQFPELDIELVVIRPKHSFKWVCENKGFPITSKDTAGKIRKITMMKMSQIAGCSPAEYSSYEHERKEFDPEIYRKCEKYLKKKEGGGRC